MRKFIFAILLSVPACAQVVVGNYGIQYVSAAPSGSCGGASPLTIVQPGGSLYTCQNGTWGTVSGGGGGTPGGTTGQIQYNNAGAFGGANMLTDATASMLGVGISSPPTNPLQVGSGANDYLRVSPPSGTYATYVQIRPGGSSASAGMVWGSSGFCLCGPAGGTVTMAYAGGGSTSASFSTSSGQVNYLSFAGGTTGNPATVTATGADTNININLTPKGTGLVNAGGMIRTASYTVATLPACSASIQGALASVTDAATPTYLGTLTGGGTTYTPVVCNGTAWVSH